MLRNRRNHGEIPSISNELEFSLHNTTAANVLENATRELELSHEVNQVDVVEMMVSMAPDVESLNTSLPAVIALLSEAAQDDGGELYGGSSLLRDVSDREPRWYRTTSLSRTLARGFLDITSQQLVIGIGRKGSGNQAGEAFGMQLYNFLRQLSPVLVALSASSPYQFEDGELVTTGAQSRRPAQYQSMSRNLPQRMFATPPLHSLAEHENFIHDISRQVNQRLQAGTLDSNDEELYADRDGESYAPFEQLAPHQIYSWVRIRPDHANSDSVFSLELRAADLPIEISMMQTLNSFIAGLSYFAARNGFSELNTSIAPLNLAQTDIQHGLLAAGQMGLDARIGRGRVRSIVPQLIEQAISGLQHRNLPYETMEFELNQVLQFGNDAARITDFVEATAATPEDLRTFLTAQLSSNTSHFTR